MKRIFSLVVALVAMQAMFAAVKEITVTSVEDDYENPAKGTLRWACAQASATTSVEITFDISGSGSKVIQLSDQITISGDVTIDASSSADSIIIDGDRNYCFYLYNNEETKLSLILAIRSEASLSTLIAPLKVLILSSILSAILSTLLSIPINLIPTTINTTISTIATIYNNVGNIVFNNNSIITSLLLILFIHRIN